MPKDANNKPLAINDRVSVRATIVSLGETDDYCNCRISLDYLMPPYHDKTVCDLNSAQVELIPPEKITGGPGGPHIGALPADELTPEPKADDPD